MPGSPPAEGTLLYGNEPCCSNLYEGLLSRVEWGMNIYGPFSHCPIVRGLLLGNIITRTTEQGVGIVGGLGSLDALHMFSRSPVKYTWQFEQIHFAIWTNIFCYLNKYILLFGQIHFAIWTNTFCYLDKYTLQFGK